MRESRKGVGRKKNSLNSNSKIIEKEYALEPPHPWQTHSSLLSPWKKLWTRACCTSQYNVMYIIFLKYLEGGVNMYTVYKC